MESLAEIVDGYEYIVDEGRIPSDLMETVKILSIAGKSSHPGPRPLSSQNETSDSRAVVAAPQDRICTDVEEEPGVGDVGFGVQVASDDTGVHEAVQFVDDVMKRFAFSPLKVSMVSQGLASNQFPSPAPPIDAAACGEKVVPLADTVSEICINESNDEVVVSSVRKSPLGDASKHAATDGEAFCNFEGYGPILSRKRKATGKMTRDFVGEPMELTDLGLSIEKKDPVGESETANQNLGEKLRLEALEDTEKNSIALEEVPELSIAKGNSSGKYGAAALDEAPLSDTSGKEECSSMPVHVTRSARKPRNSRHTSNAYKPPVTRSRTRGARISDETDENRGTKDAAKNIGSGENLGVSEGGKKSRLEEISDSPEVLPMSKSKGGPAGEKISEHAARFNDPSLRKEGNSGQGSSPVTPSLTFLQAIKILTRKTDRGIGDESILTVARRAGYTFPSYSATGT